MRAKYPSCPYDFRPFHKELHRLGFKRKYPVMRVRSSGPIGFCWAQIYHKVGRDFDLEVMLDSEGEHTARHFFKGRNTERGTEFSTPAYLEAAVDTEMAVIKRKRTGWQTPEMKEIDKVWALRNAHIEQMEAQNLGGSDVAQAHYNGSASCTTLFKDGRKLHTTRTKRGVIRSVWG